MPKIVPYSNRKKSSTVLAAVIAVGSIILSAIMWLVAGSSVENVTFLVIIAMIPTGMALMSISSLITGKPWYLEVLVASLLLS